MKTCIYLIFSLYAICIQAQDIYNNLNQKFTQYLIKTLPENIYVQTDKPYYVVEDTIWMKAFVVNAQLLQPSPSNFVYVELINQQNEVLNRIKLKKDSAGFQGPASRRRCPGSGSGALRKSQLRQQFGGAVHGIGGERLPYHCRRCLCGPPRLYRCSGRGPSRLG